MAKRKNNYTGILNEPIIRPNLLHTEEEHNLIIREAVCERLAALYKHYGIQPPADPVHTPENGLAPMELVYALAKEHVRGFTVVECGTKNAHRPIEYTKSGIKGLRLWALVKKHMLEAGYTKEMDGVRAVVEQEPEYKGALVKTVWRRYMEVKEEGHKANVILYALKEMVLSGGCPEEKLEEELVKRILTHFLPPIR